MAPMESHQQKIIHTTPQDPTDPAAPSARLKTAPQTRTCIVTRQAFAKKDLLRFTLTGKNIVSPDILQKQPGRGLYVRPERAYVQQAIKKNSFAHAARKQTKVPEDLIPQVEKSLRHKALQLLTQAFQQGKAVSDNKMLLYNNKIISYINLEKEVCSSHKEDHQHIDIITINDINTTIGLNCVLNVSDAHNIALLDSAVTRNLLDAVRQLQLVQSNPPLKEDQNA